MSDTILGVMVYIAVGGWISLWAALNVVENLRALVTRQRLGYIGFLELGDYLFSREARPMEIRGRWDVATWLLALAIMVALGIQLLSDK